MGRPFSIFLIIAFLLLSNSLYSQNYPAHKITRKYPIQTIDKFGNTQIGQVYPENRPSLNPYRGNDAAWIKKLESITGRSSVSDPVYKAAPDGRSVYGGCDYLNPEDGRSIYLVKLDTNGTKLWDVEYDGVYGLQLRDLFILNDESILIRADVRHSDDTFYTHILNYSPDGNMLSDVEFGQISDNANYQEIFTPGNNQRIYRTNVLDIDYTNWYWTIEVYSEDGVKLNTFTSETYDQDFSVSTILSPDGSPLVIVRVDSKIFYYCFNQNLDLLWSYDLADFFANEENSYFYTNVIFDSSSNIYSAISNSNLIKLIRQTSTGAVVWEQNLKNNFYVKGLGISDNHKITIVMQSDSTLYINRFDTSGYAEIEGKEYAFHDLIYSYPDFSFASQTGYFTVYNGLFDNNGTCLAKTDEAPIFFTGNRLYRESGTESLQKINFQLEAEWQYDLSLPLDYSTYYISSTGDGRGNIISLTQQYYTLILSKTDQNGNTLWTKDIFENEYSIYYSSIEQLSENRFVVLIYSFAPPNDLKRQKVVTTIVYDLYGNELFRNKYFFDFNYSFYNKPILKNQTLYWQGSLGYFITEGGNEIYRDGIILLKFNERGEKIFQKAITKFNSDHFNLSFNDFWFVDSENNFNYILDVYNGEYNSVRHSGVFQVSSDNEIHTYELDIELPYEVSFMNDHWGHIYTAWKSSSENSGENAFELVKLSSQGKRIWQKTITFASEGDYASIKMIPAKTDGSMGLFFNRYYDQTGTTYFLFDTDGNVIQQSELGEMNIHQLQVSPDSKEIIIESSGINPTIYFMNVESGSFRLSRSQSDPYNRDFSIRDFIWGKDYAYFYVGGYYSYVGSVVMRFNLNDSLDYSIDQQNVTLDGSFPNPTNGQTAIRYTLPVDGDVEITIYNTLGQQIHKATSYQLSGDQVFYYRERSLASGLYFYTVKQNGNTANGKFLIIK